MIDAPDTSSVFDSWLYSDKPDWRWDWPHLQYIQYHLTRLTHGHISKLMIMCPPQHGKSELVTVRYTAWSLIQDPTLRCIIGAYNQIFANKFSRKIRKIVNQHIPLATDNVADWETTEEGGLRVVGVGSGVTGQSGDLIGIDDPIKSREEANSATYRQRTWQWYTNDLSTRIQPDSRMFLILTRWHEDDLAGRILNSAEGPDWTVIRMPALAEEDDPLGRAEGAALCPDRYDVPYLLKRKEVLGRQFTGLFQQRPTEQEGGMFKRSYFRMLPGGEAALPDVDAKGKPITYMIARGWDMAATAGGGDWTVGVKIAAGGGMRYVLDVVREQTDDPVGLMVQTAHQDGKGCYIYFEEEGGSSGKIASSSVILALAGFKAVAIRSTGSKEVRAMPTAARFKAGKLVLLYGYWNTSYIDELCSFPLGGNDDQVDATSLCDSQMYDGPQVWG